jgi:hypothetical protein
MCAAATTQLLTSLATCFSGQTSRAFNARVAKSSSTEKNRIHTVSQGFLFYFDARSGGHQKKEGDAALIS